MSKMGKFLAAKKGKTSVKASADTALHSILAVEDPAETLRRAEGPHGVLSSCAAGRLQNVEEWGVDESEEETSLPGGPAVVLGTHFHLITEEDVAKKNYCKGPKKWGDVDKKDVTTALTTNAASAVGESTDAVPSSTPAPSAADEASASSTPEAAGNGAASVISSALGVPLARLRAARAARNRIDMESHQLFPDLEPATAPSPGKPPVSSQPGSQKAKSVGGPGVKPSQKGATSSGPPPATVPTIEESKTDVSQAQSVLTIEQFLKDIVIDVKPDVSMNEDHIRQKFVGRSKRPYINLPALELQTTLTAA